jgi:hypothetical protein
MTDFRERELICTFVQENTRHVVLNRFSVLHFWAVMHQYDILSLYFRY